MLAFNRTPLRAAQQVRLTAVPHRLKRRLKRALPQPLIARWQRFRFDREQAAARGKPLETVFSDIYENNTWAKPADGARYSSGPGSAPEMTKGYEDFVVGYIDRHPEVRRLVDIGCGDFQVAGRILARLERPITYIGCDIAANVVAYNEQTYGRPGVSFRCLDVTRDAAPDGDLVTVREVFQHLSNDAILAALANLRRSFTHAIVTEYQPAVPCTPNLDIASGYRTRDGLNSGVFLSQPPFSLAVLETYDTTASATERLRTKLVAL